MCVIPKCDVVRPTAVRAGGKTPVLPGREASCMLRGLMLRMGKIYWARADV